MVFALDRTSNASRLSQVASSLTPRTPRLGLPSRTMASVQRTREQYGQEGVERAREAHRIADRDSGQQAQQEELARAAHARALAQQELQLQQDARKLRQLSTAQMTPRTANRTRSEIMAAGRRRWEAQQAAYYGHARRAMPRAPEYGRPEPWMHSRLDRDPGNRLATRFARSSVGAPDARTSTRPGNGTTRDATGAFRPVWPSGPGHICFERYKRGIPRGYGGYIPNHLNEDRVATIGPPDKATIVRV